MSKNRSLLLLSLLLFTFGSLPAQADDPAKKLAAALERALQNSDYAQKKRLAELRDVADPHFPGFRLVGADGTLQLGTTPRPADLPADAISCAVCGAHLFDVEHRLGAHSDTHSEDLTFSQPSTPEVVVTDLHSEWSAENGQIELRCALCGNHLGHVDPGTSPTTPLRFVLEPEQVKEP